MNRIDLESDPSVQAALLAQYRQPPSQRHQAARGRVAAAQSRSTVMIRGGNITSVRVTDLNRSAIAAQSSMLAQYNSRNRPARPQAQPEALIGPNAQPNHREINAQLDQWDDDDRSVLRERVRPGPPTMRGVLGKVSPLVGLCFTLIVFSLLTTLVVGILGMTKTLNGVEVGSINLSCYSVAAISLIVTNVKYAKDNRKSTPWGAIVTIAIIAIPIIIAHGMGIAGLVGVDKLSAIPVTIAILAAFWATCCLTVGLCCVGAIAASGHVIRHE